jgi:hypothetical protein
VGISVDVEERVDSMQAAEPHDDVPELDDLLQGVVLAKLFEEWLVACRRV